MTSTSRVSSSVRIQLGTLRRLSLWQYHSPLVHAPSLDTNSRNKATNGERKTKISRHLKDTKALISRKSNCSYPIRSEGSSCVRITPSGTTTSSVSVWLTPRNTHWFSPIQKISTTKCTEFPISSSSTDRTKRMITKNSSTTRISLSEESSLEN